jgi:hypothetical protein
MELRVHLKICEACGCLWYRAQADTRVYCAACDLKFKEFPTAQSRKRRGRPRKIVLPTVFAVHAPYQDRYPACYPVRFTPTTSQSVTMSGGAK